MASSHERQRPQLNVDMSLQPSTEDEPTIRMNVISKKRRLRYALMEESSDDDEEDDSKLETQQSAGQEPFEGNYQLSVPYPAKNQEEQFVLPPSEHGSSSSESDSDEEEENFVNRPPQRQQHESARLMQPPVREYANEEDLFDAAFVAPENRFLRQHAREEQNVQHDHGLLSRNHDSFRQNPPQPQYTTEPQVFDLCASDEEQTVDFTAEHQATFFGVQRHEKSPRFNANSRHVFSPHAAPAARRPSAKAAPTTNDNDDDIVECWSSDDEEGNTKPRARRVTNDEPWNRRPQGNHNTTGSFAASRNHAAPRASSTFHASNDNDDDFDRMPAPSRQKNVLNQYKADRTAADRRNGRRLRDATTGMHSAASIPFPRNDLQGGSGVGLGGYTLGHQSFQQSCQQAVAPVATGRKQKAATKKGGKKRGGGGGKRNYYRKRGGGKKSKKSSSTSSSRGGGGGGRGRSRASKRGAGSNEEYSRKDPLLKNVGGASIIF